MVETDVVTASVAVEVIVEAVGASCAVVVTASVLTGIVSLLLGG